MKMHGSAERTWLSPDGNSNTSRRDFLAATSAAVLGTVVAGCQTGAGEHGAEPIIDIHQHVGYSGRSDEELLAHQQKMGASKTILLPAGRPVNSPATHEGVSNGLQAKCLGNEACYQFAKAHPKEYKFGANEVPDLNDATKEIEIYLNRGGIIIAEQKFGVECDSAAMQRIYEVAAAHNAPVLMHWQYQMYNYGIERFYKMLEKYPRTVFIGHAQTWWANIDKNYKEPMLLYPKGPVTPGGLTDRYLSDYPNMYGDLSAGSGQGALLRDEPHAREFIQKHQDKLLFGSDCHDSVGAGPDCIGATTIEAIRRLAPSKKIERKLLYGNAKKILKV